MARWAEESGEGEAKTGPACTPGKPVRRVRCTMHRGDQALQLDQQTNDCSRTNSADEIHGVHVPALNFRFTPIRQWENGIAARKAVPSLTILAREPLAKHILHAQHTQLVRFL